MNITIILPSLDPDEKLVQTVDGLLAEGFDDVVVVNDGSGETHRAPFAEAAERPGVTVLTHEKNRGKGAALKTAFAFVAEHRPNTAGVVTVDGDGQHRPADVKRLAEALLGETQPTLWLGVRDFSLPNVPPRSRAGNRTTLTILRLLCGVRVTDSQTGLRAAPASLLPALCRVKGERYEYETEMLLWAQREGIPFGEIGIETVYIDENQTSHYRPFRDSMRVLGVILRGLGRYISSSLLCFLVDEGLFTLLNLLLAGAAAGETEERLAVAVVGARLVSSLLNYVLNRRVVFRRGEAVKRSLWRYYALAVVQVAASYGLLTLLSNLLRATPAVETPLKLLVDFLLFLASYQIQMRWVFKK